MSYDEEIEHLEKRLLMYKKGVTGGHTARENLLYKNIKSMEKQLDILKRAKAFDEGLEAVYDRLQHILHNTDTSKLLPGYVDGMYNALDIINDCYERGESE